MPRSPRSANLPGLDDRVIQPLEDIAASYADVRDRRMALNKEEAELKTAALALMHKHGKTVYSHDGIEIRLEPGEETVKVKIQKKADEDEEADV